MEREEGWVKVLGLLTRRMQVDGWLCGKKGGTGGDGVVCLVELE